MPISLSAPLRQALQSRPGILRDQNSTCQAVPCHPSISCAIVHNANIKTNLKLKEKNKRKKEKKGTRFS
jgi:hypothetical protein